MNRKLFLIPLILLLINFACQKETGQKPKTAQQTPKKYSFVIKREQRLEDYKSLQADKTGKIKEFFKLLETFQPQSYSLDELIDLTEKDLKIIKTLKTGMRKASLDTAAIKSRLVLTEIYLQKLNYLIHKKKPQKDTIAKTLNAIVLNLNSLVNQIKIYENSTDEFEDILHHDSIVQNKNEQILNPQKQVRLQKPRGTPTNKRVIKRFNKFKKPPFIKKRK